MKESFSKAEGRGKFGQLILKSTNASKVLTPEVLAEVITQEAEGHFDAKCAIPGHVQQGGLPSPIDRTRGTRFAIRAVSFIESQQDVLKEARTLDDEDFAFDDDKIVSTASVLGVKGSDIVFTSIRQLYDYETHLERRTPKKIHWAATRAIADHLVGRKKL